MTADPLQALVAALLDAKTRAEAVAGAPVAGVRAVEPAHGQRWYLCAFDGPRVLCLDAQLEVERSGPRCRRAAACALLVEHAEGLIEQGELDVLAAASATLAGMVETPELGSALTGLREAALALAVWRAAPARAIASLSGVEVGIRLHDEARRNYDRYVEGTEPLVTMQDRLGDELIAALRDLDESAGRAGITQPLASLLAEAMDVLDAGADEMVAIHITPLDQDA